MQEQEKENNSDVITGKIIPKIFKLNPCKRSIVLICLYLSLAAISMTFISIKISNALKPKNDMKGISFEDLLLQSLKEYGESKSFFGVPVVPNPHGTPVGPAAGPHTQLTGNIIAAYAAGARIFDLKTIQILAGEALGIQRPCIYVGSEVYNIEWSSEFDAKNAMNEYIKAAVLIQAFAKEFDLRPFNELEFIISVGYDLKGIKSEIVDSFIENMKDAKNTEEWKEDIKVLKANINLFKKLKLEDIDKFESKLTNTVTLSTMHGCPAQDIEQIGIYLMKEKKLNTYIKMNPTLLGKDKLDEILKTKGYDIVLPVEVFKNDIDLSQAISIIHNCKKVAANEGLKFGVKLTNTLPTSIQHKELAGETMYMSGPGLYALSINVANILANEFNGDLPIAYSGGIDDKNIKDVLSTGINPITLSSFLLKPKGYKNIGKLLVDIKIPEKIDTNKLKTLAENAIKDKNYDRKDVKVYECKPNYSEFCAACHNCEDVCPNRANRRININGKDVVLHDPDLCNECGACAHNCIMGHKPYLEKACTLEPPTILSKNLSLYFLGVLLGIIALFICTKKFENKKYILVLSLVGSAIVPILSKVITMKSCCLLTYYCTMGFFNGFLFVYNISWIEQFGKQNKKIAFLSLIPLIIGFGIFIAYNYQAHIPCIQSTILGICCIIVLFIENKIYDSSIVLFKSGSKYYNIETIEENEKNDYARESLFRNNENKEEKKGSLYGKVIICGIISLSILVLCGICGLAKIKLNGEFGVLIGIPAISVIFTSLIISSYNCCILPYSIIIVYIIGAIFGNVLTKCSVAQYGFILCINLLFIQIVLLILSKLNVNNKNCGIGLIGIVISCTAACANCLNKLCEDCIMYLMCIGVIFAAIACYYKIKGIKEMKKKGENNDIELEDIDHE